MSNVEWDGENTDPRTPRFPKLSLLERHNLLIIARQQVGRAISVAELRALASEDRELKEMWRELKTAAVTVGQAAVSVSALLNPRQPKKGFEWLYLIITTEARD